jgi:TetR/AcrR family transcriptional repressor of nem operon
VPRTERPSSDTAERILDVAQRLVQTRGFNGFSYADVASELGITTASLHYHYASKAQLGEALIDRYAARFSQALAAIEARPDPAPAKLAAYADLYAGVLEAERLCLCGMLAADYDTLPNAMRSSVVEFFDDNEVWLSRVLEKGRDEGTLDYQGSAVEAARMIVCALEGAMLVARPYGDSARFQSAATRLVESLSVASHDGGSAGR